MHKCYECGVSVDMFSAYCGDCVAAQLEEYGNESEAFNAYHEYADLCLGVSV